ncbi:Tir chaperone protein (CesT) [Pseudovibrio sp. Ad5]|uniref:type III secretion system chaperone n=1 Tax=Pseudovibrio sp. Ad5 TaxID=989436 RepID=UPI0007AECF9B|nr:type III secretion system chaperone [Pseudovibrio sp. Ad5]KZL00766.1 Tir chaperone protein (CesT) [Pseudovibrio sp. Ad5]
MSKQNAENVLVLFGEQIGLSNLCLTEAGECVLQFDELVLQLFCGDDWLKALIVLSDEDEVPANMMAKMLHENFHAVHAYSFARTPMGQAALLASLPTSSLNLTIFSQWVEEILKVAGSWQAKLQGTEPVRSEVLSLGTTDFLPV